MTKENANGGNSVQETEFEKAQRSMAGRVDQDDAEKKPDDTEQKPKEDINPVDKPEDKPADGDKPEDGADDTEKKPDGDNTDQPNKKPERPVAYIPMPKYLAEKTDWEKDKSALAEANKEIEKLKALSNQKDGAQKDEDIEAFMEATGFDRPTTNAILKLAQNRLLTPEKLAALNNAENIVKENKLKEQFTAEFTSVGEPELKRNFPTATEAQLAEARKYLDQVAHSKEFHTQTLDFVIYKNLENLKKIFADAPAPADDKKGDEEKPDDTQNGGKKTIESKRIGSGKPSSVSAKDFEGATDFSALNEMEPVDRNRLIKDFPTKTYENFKIWVSQQQPGVEVMRNGQKVILK